MAHEGHIIIPMETQLRLQAEWHEYDATRKAWRRPWVYGERKRMSGRVKEILNIPVRDPKGNILHRWNPFQVAVFAVLSDGPTAGYDVVRVKTPADLQTPGYKAVADIDFSAAQIKKCIDKDSIFFVEVMNGHIRFDDEAANDMPKEWVITPNGTFAPE